MPRPEDAARADIDAALAAAGWVVQDRGAINLDAGPGVSVREFPLRAGFGFADYLLYTAGQAVGVIEAKRAGTTLTGVEVQAEKYAAGIPPHLSPPVEPLPFLYQSTGVETFFTNRLDPEPRSRRVFAFHRPDTLARWIAAEAVWLPPGADGAPAPLTERPASFRTRLLTFPDVPDQGLRVAQVRAVRNVEVSLRQNRPRALIQLATGAGKTVAAITSIYRLIKYGDASRLLSIADETEAAVRAQLARAERLRQSVLAGAFEGKLVPQDPNDEPASVLLVRIHDAQHTTETTKPRRRSARRPTPREMEP
jgi:type I restriction enzyme R subunit